MLTSAACCANSWHPQGMIACMPNCYPRGCRMRTFCASPEERFLLTADKDFGELVYRRLLAVPGVVLLRLRAASEAERLALFRRHWPAVERSVPGHFVVVTNRTVRRSPLPRPDAPC